jgi:hypothetical protein
MNRISEKGGGRASVEFRTSVGNKWSDSVKCRTFREQFSDYQL